MFPRDLVLVGADEAAVADDLLAADVEPVDAVRRRRGRGRRPGSSAPPSSSPSVRQTAKSARLPGSSEPMSSRPSTAAPPRVPSRSASRAVIAVRAAAAARDEQRLLDLEEEVAALVRGRAVDAEPDADARVEQLAHGRDAGAEAQVRRRAVRDADAVSAERRDVVVGEVDAVRAPDVVREPAELARGTRPGVQP